METRYLFIRPLLADCSLHEESELDLHYNNLWLQLQRWLSFCIDFCILIFIFSLGHTGRKEPLQNLWQVSGRGGWGKKKIISLIHCWLDFHVATTDSTESEGRVSPGRLSTNHQNLSEKKSSCLSASKSFSNFSHISTVSSCMCWALAQQQGLLIQPWSTTAAAHVQVQVSFHLSGNVYCL